MSTSNFLFLEFSSSCSLCSDAFMRLPIHVPYSTKLPPTYPLGSVIPSFLVSRAIQSCSARNKVEDTICGEGPRGSGTGAKACVRISSPTATVHIPFLAFRQPEVIWCSQIAENFCVHHVCCQIVRQKDCLGWNFGVTRLYLVTVFTRVTHRISSRESISCREDV